MWWRRVACAQRQGPAEQRVGDPLLKGRFRSPKRAERLHSYGHIKTPTKGGWGSAIGGG